VPINVGTYGTFASAPATSNVTFKIGSFTVDADVNTY
jgi:flavoprotein